MLFYMSTVRGLQTLYLGFLKQIPVANSNTNLYTPASSNSVPKLHHT